MGLSETKLTSQASSRVYKSSSAYQSWWSCLDSSPLSAGVGLIMKKEVAKYVQSVHGYKGRVISANLYLKGHFKMKIIQVYIQAHSRDCAARMDIDNHILNLVIKGHHDGFRVVLMGDFNVDPDKLDDLLSNNQIPPWTYNLLRTLRTHQLSDCAAVLCDSPNPTWSNHNTSSRLDLIWVSDSLLSDLLLWYPLYSRIQNRSYGISYLSFK